MSKNIKNMYKDIINDRNLQENIPALFDTTIDKYTTFAAVRLALHYYTFYEMYWDEEEHWKSKPPEYIKGINTIISEAAFQVRSVESIKEYVRQVDDIRRSITKRMELLTSYINLFELYEYALNRVEYRFKDTDQMEDDEEFTKKVLGYIFDSEDNVIINESIKEIICQLPVRITKQKYFDYLNDSLHDFEGSQEDILDSYIYMIRSSAMLDITQDMENVYPILWEKKEKLERLDFKDITQVEYEASAFNVQEAVDILEVEFTAYYSLIEIVNELYTLLICEPYFVKDLASGKEQKEAALYIIESINDAFLKDKQEELTQEILCKFEVLEGFQEDIEFDLLSLEDALYHIDQQHRTLVSGMSIDEQLDALLISKDLLSSSLFIDLDKSKSDVLAIVDKERLRVEIDKLIKELTDIFQSQDRMIIRAIMANTMDKMPVFFNTHSEVMEYILYSLNKCTDLAEKYACMEIIESIMEV
jgi:hypothetical protein